MATSAHGLRIEPGKSDPEQRFSAISQSLHAALQQPHELRARQLAGAIARQLCDQFQRARQEYRVDAAAQGLKNRTRNYLRWWRHGYGEFIMIQQVPATGTH